MGEGGGRSEEKERTQYASQFNMGAEVNFSFTSDCSAHCLTCILYTQYIHCI